MAQYGAKIFMAAWGFAEWYERESVSHTDWQLYIAEAVEFRGRWVTCSAVAFYYKGNCRSKIRDN